MTKKELAQLYYLNREIEQERQRLQELQCASTDTSARISGLPHVQGISNKTAIAVQIADCRAIIEEKIDRSVVEYSRLTRYIAQVNDSLVRQILRLRYIDGLSWLAVAQKIGGGNTEASVRMAAERYLSRH